MEGGGGGGSVAVALRLRHLVRLAPGSKSLGAIVRDALACWGEVGGVHTPAATVGPTELLASPERRGGVPAGRARPTRAAHAGGLRQGALGLRGSGASPRTGAREGALWEDLPVGVGGGFLCCWRPLPSPWPWP